ncbi:MAG: bifunctional 2-keto-4-hydroxyglutarate aldolase/2-keto-3-deoxy-6-phosphogluconate aldolase [Terracidiphilus sp.]|jgi:2-dehydro-3-deoxyphosphogluconate aldolase/(4S)-4-hydroxy-2-oxoglutarate aldolase
MKKVEVLKRIQEVGLLPVLRAASAEEALALAWAIEAGGISAIEVTMTVPGAIEVIQTLIREAGDRILIGAGTVLDPETARACMLAGANFIVSPSLNLKTIEICHRYSIAIIPGALTPTEVVTAWDAGADVVKVFPCSAMGGAKYLKALKAPFPQIELIPTGGVSLSTAAEFLAAGAFALGVGADLVNAQAIAAGTPETITHNARQYVEIVRAASALHSV